MKASSGRPARRARDHVQGGMRKEVISVLREEGRILTAYQILRGLRAKLGRRIAPTSIYRCLTDLIERGLVIRVESLNAYVAAGEMASVSDRFLLVCKGCGETRSLLDGEVKARLQTDADRIGFTINRSVLELLGTCRSCQNETEPRLLGAGTGA